MWVTKRLAMQYMAAGNARGSCEVESHPVGITRKPIVALVYCTYVPNFTMCDKNTNTFLI